MLVSNDYNYLLVQIKEYLDQKRYLCQYCKNETCYLSPINTMEKHYKIISYRMDL